MSAPCKIGTLGYQGLALSHLRDAAEGMNAIVLDIRANPWSSQPDWTRENLQVALGSRYRHLPQWGNTNWHSSRRSLGIQIASFEMGLTIARRIAGETGAAWLILLCQCPVYATCHRRTVAELLREVGISAWELTL